MSWRFSCIVVGPRPLPASGLVEVWIDTGSGPGQRQHVPVRRLFLDSTDDGSGEHAIYCLRLSGTDHP